MKFRYFPWTDPKHPKQASPFLAGAHAGFHYFYSRHHLDPSLPIWCSMLCRTCCNTDTTRGICLLDNITGLPSSRQDDILIDTSSCPSGKLSPQRYVDRTKCEAMHLSEVCFAFCVVRLLCTSVRTNVRTAALSLSCLFWHHIIDTYVLLLSLSRLLFAFTSLIARAVKVTESGVNLRAVYSACGIVSLRASLS